jgi:hypothetical protein
MTMKTKIAIAILIIAGGAMIWFQMQTQKKLRLANESLQQQIAQLQTDNENFSNQLANVSGSKKLPNDSNNKLLKLRGEVGVLQRQANEANQKAQAAEQKLATALSAQAQFTAHETDKVSDMKQLGLAMLLYANDNSGLFPTNLDQLTNSLPQSLPNWDDFNSFDFVNVGVPNAHDKYPQMIVLRERLARQAPDGTWRRVYGFADGRVVTATSYDGNFDAWEKANTYSPPPNQNQ